MLASTSILRATQEVGAIILIQNKRSLQVAQPGPAGAGCQIHVWLPSPYVERLCPPPAPSPPILGALSSPTGVSDQDSDCLL